MSRHYRHMHAPTPIPVEVERAVRIRAARAQYAAAIARCMLAQVAGGMSPRWHHGAPPEAIARWDAFEFLTGLLRYAAEVDRMTGTGEFRELLEQARQHVTLEVFGAGLTLADTLDAVAR